MNLLKQIKKNLKIFFVSIVLALMTFSTLNVNANNDLLLKNIEKIYNTAHQDSTAWELVAEICDKFGPRFVGSKNLNLAIDWSFEKMKELGFSNVIKEEVEVEHWYFEENYCKLISPWQADIPTITLGGSIGTPKDGIIAEVVAVGSKEELLTIGEKAKGKIILFDEKYKNYGHNVQYRVWGADLASKYGAVAALIRPVTPQSYQNPHTGVMRYSDTLKKIPVFSVTDEACDLIRRLTNRNIPIVVKLFSDAKFGDNSISYNVMSEIKGTEKSEEIVAIGGHIDSWETGIGSGAHDDASGCITALKAVDLLKKLGLKTKRTIRVVFWVDEEFRQTGGKKYAELHGKEPHFGLFEFDSGVFPPIGIGFSGPDSIYNKLEEFNPVLKIINDKISFTKGGGGVDIMPMGKLGYPTMGLRTEGNYFLYHHSQMDTPEHVDPKILNDCIATMAITLYIYSNL